MPNTEIARTSVEITPADARRIVRTARRAAMTPYTLKRRGRGHFTSLGAAVHFTLLEAVRETARQRDLRKRAMTPRAILRDLLPGRPVQPEEGCARD